MLEQSRFVLELKAYLTNQWKTFNLPGSPSGLAYRIRQAPLGRTFEKSRLVALWFHDDPETPTVVTKWVLNKNMAPFIIQEHRHARWLYETQGHRFVPRPLDCHEILGVPVLIEEAVLGRSFAHQILSLPFGHEEGWTRIETTYTGMFAKAAELLTQIQKALPPVSKGDLLQYLEPYVSKAEAILEWDSQTSGEVRKLLENNIPDPVPGSGKTLLIGDFGPQNILQGEKGIFIIDLEFSLESPLAFLDPLSFVYTLSRLSIPTFSQEEVSGAVRLLKEHLLNVPDRISEMSQHFLKERGISLAHLAWYWLVFFIHETAFQAFLAETLPPQPKQFFSLMLSSLCQPQKAHT